MGWPSSCLKNFLALCCTLGSRKGCTCACSAAPSCRGSSRLGAFSGTGVGAAMSSVRGGKKTSGITDLPLKEGERLWHCVVRLLLRIIPILMCESSLKPKNLCLNMVAWCSSEVPAAQMLHAPPFLPRTRRMPKPNRYEEQEGIKYASLTCQSCHTAAWGLLFPAVLLFLRLRVRNGARGVGLGPRQGDGEGDAHPGGRKG